MKKKYQWTGYYFHWPSSFRWAWGKLCAMCSVFACTEAHYIDTTDSFCIHKDSPLCLTWTFPNSIQAAFQRREKGLQLICKLRSSTFQLYLAHASWNFQSDALGFERLGHSDEVINLLMGILCDLSRILTLPCVTRAVCTIKKYPTRSIKMWLFWQMRNEISYIIHSLLYAYSYGLSISYFVFFRHGIAAT